MSFTLVAAIVVALMLAALLACWLRNERRRILYVLAGVGTAAACVLLHFNDFASLGRDIVVLQAGLSDVNIAHVFGRGNHFCRTCAAIPDAMSAIGIPGLPIQNVILLNRLLFILNIAGLAVVAMAVSRRFLISMFFAVGVAMVPVVEIGFDANYPSAFLMSLFLAGTLCGAVYVERDRSGTAAAALAVVTMAVLATVAFLTRPESAVPGVAALAAMAAGGRKLPFIRRPRDWFRPALAAFLLMAALLGLSMALHGTAFPVWIIDGINPLDPSTVTSVADLVMLLPLTMALLVFAGLLRMLKLPRRFLLLPFALIFLLKTASSASRFDLHTIFRMFSVVAPLLLVAGVWGLGWLVDLMSARLPDARLRFLLTLLVIASFGVGTPFARRAIRVDRPAAGYLDSLEAPDSMLSMNPQLEVRFIAQALDSHPGCTFRSRVMARGDYAAVNSGGSEGRFVDVWFSRAGVSYDAPAGSPDCLLLYRSLDCSIAGLDGCAGMLDGASPIREVSFMDRPYGNYLLVEYDDPVVLGIYMPPAQP